MARMCAGPSAPAWRQFLSPVDLCFAHEFGHYNQVWGRDHCGSPVWDFQDGLSSLSVDECRAQIVMTPGPGPNDTHVTRKMCEKLCAYSTMVSAQVESYRQATREVDLGRRWCCKMNDGSEALTERGVCEQSGGTLKDTPASLGSGALPGGGTCAPTAAGMAEPAGGGIDIGSGLSQQECCIQGGTTGLVALGSCAGSVVDLSLCQTGGGPIR